MEEIESKIDYAQGILSEILRQSREYQTNIIKLFKQNRDVVRAAELGLTFSLRMGDLTVGECILGIKKVCRDGLSDLLNKSSLEEK